MRDGFDGTSGGYPGNGRRGGRVSRQNWVCSIKPRPAQMPKFQKRRRSNPLPRAGNGAEGCGAGYGAFLIRISLFWPEHSKKAAARVKTLGPRRHQSSPQGRKHPSASAPTALFCQPRETCVQNLRRANHGIVLANSHGLLCARSCVIAIFSPFACPAASIFATGLGDGLRRTCYRRRIGRMRGRLAACKTRCQCAPIRNARQRR